ncbi:MAG TPA: acyl-CoA carboxylase subunit epsilon [Propionibacteriaceae bacterium]|nr:acyl-CoA carboxylase subunit epsilon [Propionibacteriaceae bacterium]
MTSPDDQDPLFSVVKGSPTEDELAAVMAVLTAQFAQQRQEAATPGRSGWSAYWRSVRSPIQPGPSAWRMSGRPQ